MQYLKMARVPILMTLYFGMGLSACAEVHSSITSKETEMRELSDAELKSLLSDVYVRDADSVSTRVAETFKSDGTYIYHGRLKLEGSFTIESGLVCSKTIYEAGTGCKKVMTDINGDKYFVVIKNGSEEYRYKFLTSKSSE